jgi:hypothetical protein
MRLIVGLHSGIVAVCARERRLRSQFKTPLTTADYGRAGTVGTITRGWPLYRAPGAPVLSTTHAAPGLGSVVTPASLCWQSHSEDTV